MKSKVYFTKVNTKTVNERVPALKKVADAAGPFDVLQKDEIVPVKLTVGDTDCAYNIRPEYAKFICSEISSKQAKPFIFDTNVIYKGSRQNAVDHLSLADRKGLGYTHVGAPFIIADGVLGQDGKELSIDSKFIKKVKTPSFVGMLDSLFVLTHVTGHILSAYAGSIKNVGMGMSCRASKQVQHSSVKPRVIQKNCTACGCCIAVCPASAIGLKDSKAYIESKLCIGCGECLCACKFDAIMVNWKEDAPVFCNRMVDAAGAILSKFKNRCFINFAFEITKECDCISSDKDQIISDDIGIFMSNDIVSIEKATVDIINKKEDLFLKAQGNDYYHKMLEYAADRGLGNLAYELIEI